jgi:hypothetical protein
MLHTIFGNRNAERILLFLFVNEKCYATQIQTLLQVPLTPIQNALQRLEKGGLTISHFEGKARIYQFNPAYPLLPELEILLKKAYMLLPVQEKKQYCFIHKPKLSLKNERIRERNIRRELDTFWQRLEKTNHLEFTAKTELGLKTGRADVAVTSSSSSLIFEERGVWIPGSAFSNCFRWTLDAQQGLISLEHMRYGPDRPVFLFQLAPTRAGVLESVDSHLCASDTYLGNIIWNQRTIDFHWRIIGPRKNDELIYRYS